MKKMKLSEKKVLQCNIVILVLIYVVFNMEFFWDFLHKPAQLPINLARRSSSSSSSSTQMTIPENRNDEAEVLDFANQSLLQLKQTVERLQRDFQKKLSEWSVKKIAMPRYCDKTDTKSNSCSGRCKRLSIDKDFKVRVSQVVEPSHLQLTKKYHRVIEAISREVKGHYHVIIVTASSDNHFLESQGLVKSVHQKVFPHHRNVSLVYFDLGLSDENRAQLEKHCRCQVVSFPFQKFPAWFGNLQCYTWKPIIVKALIGRADVLMWADASVRFNRGPVAFRNLVAETKKRGLQFAANYRHDIATRTALTMFHFFGEEPCAFLGLGEIQATVGLFWSEFLVERLFLEPWAACALNRKCMCPSPYPGRSIARSREMLANWVQGKGSVTYGLGHRYDQSALNILIMKLYRERYIDVVNIVMEHMYLSIQRDSKVDYFHDILKTKKSL